MILQFGAVSVDAETLASDAEKYLMYDRDMPPIDQVNVEIYVKTDESKAYVVVDGTEEGFFLL